MALCLLQGYTTCVHHGKLSRNEKCNEACVLTSMKNSFPGLIRQWAVVHRFYCQILFRILWSSETNTRYKFKEVVGNGILSMLLRLLD